MEHAVLVTLKDQPGTLFLLIKVLAEHNADISYVDIINRPAEAAQIYFEFDLEGSVIPIMDGCREDREVPWESTSLYFCC